MKNGMKQTEIGEIPVEWEVVALQDVAQRVKTKDAGGEHEVLTISAKVGFVRQEDRYSRYMAGESVKNYTLLKQGQFSYNKGNSLTYPFGCIYRLDNYTQALVPNVYISFELNNATDSDFCRHLFLEGEFISRLKPFITSGVRGNGLLNVNAEDFFSLKLALPPLTEQQKIAEVLSTLDEKMAVMDEQLAQTQELKKGLMQRLLTKGIGHTQFKDSPLGEIPASWETFQFEKLLEAGVISKIQDGNHGEKHPVSADFVNEGVPFIAANCITKLNALDLSKAKRITEKLYNSLRIGFSTVGDVLLTHKGTIGLTALVTEQHGNIMLTPQVTYYRVGNPNKLHNVFLYYFFQTEGFQKVLDKMSKQSTRDYIGIIAQSKLFSLLPPLPEQRQIAEILTTVDEKIGVLQDKKAQVQALKRGLMQQLLTGQRRVRVPATEVAELV